MTSDGISSKSDFSPHRHFVLKYFKLVFFGYMSSAAQSFTKIYKRNFEKSWNFYKKSRNDACTEDWT